MHSYTQRSRVRIESLSSELWEIKLSENMKKTGSNGQGTHWNFPANQRISMMHLQWLSRAGLMGANT